jgi:DNA primase
LAETVTDYQWLSQLAMPGHEILKTMIEILHQSPNLTVGALVEHWRDTHVFPHLMKLANEELITPFEGMQQELQAIFVKLKKAFNEQRFTELQQKSQRGPLNPEEKQEYQKLLLEL